MLSFSVKIKFKYPMLPWNPSLLSLEHFIFALLFSCLAYFDPFVANFIKVFWVCSSQTSDMLFFLIQNKDRSLSTSLNLCVSQSLFLDFHLSTSCFPWKVSLKVTPLPVFLRFYRALCFTVVLIILLFNWLFTTLAVNAMNVTAVSVLCISPSTY